MAIYRGDGGAGDATNDVTVNQIADLSLEAQDAATAAASSATSASSSASAASTSATNAANSATSAGTSATNAASSASAASTSASNASTSETNAAASETAAAASETAAALSETAAAASETNAASSASSASTSASTATTQASNAATSATNAANSASAASTSETNAATSETNAATSETNAATSETNAAASATAAAASATDAAASASAFLASEAYTITSTDTTNWDTAYGWGNHATAGYLTTETSHADVVVDGDFGTAGLMTSNGAGVYSITTNNSTNWDTAYGWGDHASAGYALTSDIGTTIQAYDATLETGATKTPRKNAIINGNFGVNQRAVSGTVTLAAGEYGHDRWKAGASGCTYTFAASANVTTLTITAGSLIQVIEGSSLFSGTYSLSWTGTAQGKIGAGSYSASGVTGAATGGTNLNIEFNTGTLSKVQFEPGPVVTDFEPRSIGEEFALCRRYYETSMINNNITDQAQAIHWRACSSTLLAQVKYAVEKRTVPTLTVYSPNSSTAGKVYNRSTTADANSSPVFIGRNAFVENAVVADTNSIAFHFTADAEI